MAMKYIGSSFLPGIPARDLTDEEVEKYGGEEFLTALKIYKKVDEKEKEKPVTSKRVTVDKEQIT